jgi:recA bacterial DNA recombination protein|nr:MAG TPA: Protein recA [Caudoviricetes sp.]
MSKLDEIISKINKENKEELIGKSNIKTKEFKRIPLTTPALSYIFRGGLPNTIIQLLGEPSSGKSTLCYSITGQAQKLFKKEWEDEVAELKAIEKPNKEQQLKLSKLEERGHKKCLYVDVEYTSEDSWMVKNGVDLDDLVFLAPTSQSAEEIFQMILDIMESDGIGLVVLDSIPALTSQQAMDKSLTEKTYCGISGSLTTFCSKLLTYCKKYDCGFIFCNQPRIDVSGYHRIMYNGGQMLKHTFSINLYLKKGSYLDENYNELKSHPEEAKGQITEVEALKLKGVKPDRRMCKVVIDFENGIDGLGDVATMAIGMNILVKAGAWISYSANSGEELKWQGKANLIKELRENKELYQEIYDKVMQEVVNG